LLLVLAVGVSVASVLQAGAQTLSPLTLSPAQKPDSAAAEAAVAPDTNDADVKDADINELDWSQLHVDASTVISPASKARVPPQAGPPAEMSWSSQDKPNGSAALSAKQPLSPFWDARIGADMTVAPQPATESEMLSEKLANGGSLPQSSGTAWAAVTAPGVGAIWDKTAVEARLDPAQEQSKLGTSLSKTLPLDAQYSLSLQNGYNVTEQGIVPVPGIAAHPARNYETEQLARPSIADTGTSFIAGQTLSSADDKWLRKIGAEQKLFGGVSITGTIGETPLGTSSKSLTAGFKHSW
jgi:hypothetical protein